MCIVRSSIAQYSMRSDGLETVASPDLDLKPVFSTIVSVFHACAREKNSAVDFQLSDPATKNPFFGSCPNDNLSADLGPRGHTRIHT